MEPGLAPVPHPARACAGAGHAAGEASAAGCVARCACAAGSCPRSWHMRRSRCRSRFQLRGNLWNWAERTYVTARGYLGAQLDSAELRAPWFGFVVSSFRRRSPARGPPPGSWQLPCQALRGSCWFPGPGRRSLRPPSPRSRLALRIGGVGTETAPSCSPMPPGQEPCTLQAE